LEHTTALSISISISTM